jgi:hypothetical protein
MPLQETMTRALTAYTRSAKAASQGAPLSTSPHPSDLTRALYQKDSLRLYR